MANPQATTFAGIDTTSQPEDLGGDWFSRERPPVWLRAAVNIDVTDRGSLERRQGFTLLQDGTWHSLWSDGTICLGVRNNTLCQVSPDLLEASPLLAASERPMTYVSLPTGGVHFSDGVTHWRLLDGTIESFGQGGTYTRSRVHIDQAEEAAYFDTPPPGHLLEWAFGRLFVADASAIWFSQAFEPLRFDMENDYLPIAEAAMFKGVASGFYIGTSKDVFFCAGTNPKALQLRRVAAGVVAGTALVCNADAFGMKGLSGEVCVWEAVTGGKMVGSGDGQVTPLNPRAVYQTAARGASILRESNGQTHHISSFPAPSGEHNNFRASDYAVAEVRRNGIII